MTMEEVDRRTLEIVQVMKGKSAPQLAPGE
jgi:hypothetical protein